jgi:hypothetical protein
MVQEEKKLAGPDLTQGIALDELPDGGMLVGHARDEQILLVRRGSEVFAVGAQCTRYQGPLAEGLVVCHHRWRCRRVCGRGNAPSKWLPEQRRHAQQRRCFAI